MAPLSRKLITYLANLTGFRLVLWCYFIWYLIVLVRYFDPSPALWLTSLGLSGIIGAALGLLALIVALLGRAKSSPKTAPILPRRQQFRSRLAMQHEDYRIGGRAPREA